MKNNRSNCSKHLIEKVKQTEKKGPGEFDPDNVKGMNDSWDLRDGG